MESFITDDGTVAKFVHDDCSETAVKVVKSCSSFIEDDRVRLEWVDRNKYSVFISSSLGCYMRCPFCHLTIKDSQYRKLQAKAVLDNVKEAILHEVERRPSIRTRYAKLCWMGMGDAVNQPGMVHDVTLELMEWLMREQLAVGLDCVDLSTVLPPVKDSWMTWFSALDKALQPYPLNPLSYRMEQAELATQSQYAGRSRFRMFWSVHSAVQTTRDKMVPGGMPLPRALEQLRAFAQQGPNLLLHQLFVEGLNDCDAEVEALLGLLRENFADNELRVLRYNFCDRSPYREWSSVDAAVARIARRHARLKVQVSAGKEIAAACGQFLVAAPKSVYTRISVVPVASAEHAPVRWAR